MKQKHSKDSGSIEALSANNTTPKTMKQTRQRAKLAK
jgi:hypothetical protein